jgi:glutamine synthetase
VVRGKRIARAELERVFEDGLQIPYTIYFLDARGDVVDVVGRALRGSTGEGTARPVPHTLTRVNWSQRPHGQMLMTLCDAKDQPYFGEPRNVLKRVAQRFESLEIKPVIGCDLEFYLFNRERMVSGVPEPPQPSPREAPSIYGIADTDRYDAVLTGIAEAAAVQNLPVRANAREAAGHFAIAIDDISDAVRAGDDAVLLRQLVRAVARKHGLDATFMAKPYLALPGNAMNVRVALQHRAGGNVLGTSKESELLRAAIGGLQAVMAESIALFAPNANAYRRFLAGSLARNRRWGVNNSSTVLDATLSEGAVRHIEHRLAGADANPYLAIAAVLTGIHHGIAEGLDAGSPFEGDAAAFVDQTIPLAIDAALVALENGSILREYLGPAYVDLYCATKRAELDRFRNHIPAHEYDWYM